RNKLKPRGLAYPFLWFFYFGRIAMKSSLRVLSVLLTLSAVPLRAGRGEDAQLRQKIDNLIATNQKNYQDVAQAINDLNEIKQEFRPITGQLDSSQYLKKKSDRI